MSFGTTVTFLGDVGGQKNSGQKTADYGAVIYGHIADNSFQLALQAFTEANIKICNVSYKFVSTLSRPNNDINVDRCARLRYVDGSGKVYTFLLPCPLSEMCEIVEGGEIVKISSMEAFAAALKPHITGMPDLYPRRSVVWQDR